MVGMNKSAKSACVLCSAGNWTRHCVHSPWLWWPHFVVQTGVGLAVCLTAFASRVLRLQVLIIRLGSKVTFYAEGKQDKDLRFRCAPLPGFRHVPCCVLYCHLNSLQPAVLPHTAATVYVILLSNKHVICCDSVYRVDESSSAFHLTRRSTALLWVSSGHLSSWRVLSTWISHFCKFSLKLLLFLYLPQLFKKRSFSRFLFIAF